MRGNRQPTLSTDRRPATLPGTRQTSRNATPRRSKSLPSLNASWSTVRRGLVRACGILHQGRSAANHRRSDDPRTQHCFQDSTHLECCAPSRATFDNTNADGAAPGISRSNTLPMDDYGGRWCTCLSGEVCRNQFHSQPRWIAVWEPPSFRRLLVVRDGRVLAEGTPRPPLPPHHERRGSWTNYVARHGSLAPRRRRATTRRRRRRVPTPPSARSRAPSPSARSRAPSPSARSRRPGARTGDSNRPVSWVQMRTI